jgi:hypothetical protein
MSREPLASPPAGTVAGTLHWLRRDTGSPNWMVAVWAGNGWNLMDGREPSAPRELSWWVYVGPATPPLMSGSRGLDRRARSAADMALEIALPVLERVGRFLEAAAPGPGGDDFLNTGGHAEMTALRPVVSAAIGRARVLVPGD